MKNKEELIDNQLLQVNGGAPANGVIWPEFGALIITNGGAAIPALSEMVCAIRKKDWYRVSALAGKPEIAALPIVANALAASST